MNKIINNITCYRFILLVFVFITFAAPVRADDLSNPYYSGANFCGDASQLGPNSGPLSVGDASIYQSGLTAPFSLEMWATHVLKNLARKTGKPESDFLNNEHIIALVAFAYGEGGGINGNLGTYNMLNTKISDEDLQSAITGFGVYASESYATRDFPSFDIGIEAATRTMLGDYQNRTSIVLSDPASTAEQFMEALTYFDRYPGNLAWATASIDGFAIGGGRYGDSTEYLNNQLALVGQVRADYERYAGTSLDAPGQQSTSGPIPVSGSGGGSGGSVIDCQTNNGNTPGGNGSIVSIAEREFALKPVEYDENVLKYTHGSKWAWCADFVSWIYKEAGLNIGEEGRISGVLNMQQWFRENQIFFDVGTQTPQPGDVAFYVGAQTPDGGSAQHVNLVISVNGNTMTTIGGNESDSVLKRDIPISLGSESLVGFGRFK